MERLAVLLDCLVVLHEKLHSEFDIIHDFTSLADVVALMRPKQSTCLTNVLLAIDTDE